MVTGKSSLAIVISGTGSNMQALIKACNKGLLNAEVAIVISNDPLAAGLVFAESYGIPTSVVDHTRFTSRSAFELELAKIVDQSGASHVLLAGFMRVLGEEFVNRYSGRLLNIHPSLLPAYPGLNTHRRAIENGESHSGASVHFVTQQLDGGPVILQARVEISDDDTVSSLAQRILKMEHKVYPKAVQAVLSGDAKLVGDKCFWNGESRDQPRLYQDIV